jgi:tetratricopeptide (TPR) repeat protein
MLYQMASGQLPFKGDTDIETLNGIISQEPPGITAVATDTPPEVERVVRKAMEKEPDRRYQHAEDLATDLRNLERDLDTGRVSTATAVAAHKSSGPPWGRVTGLVGVVAAVVAVAMILMSRGGTTPGVAPASAEGRTVGVMGFENLSDPADEENLSRVLMGLVTTDLAETGGLLVVSSSKVLAAIRQIGNTSAGFDAAVAPEAAKIAGANIMLVGQVNQVGERMILAAELVDVDTGNTLGSLKHEAASSSELFTLAGEIAEEVRNRLGAGATAGAESFDLATTLTESPEAYREYVAGELALHQQDFSDAVVKLSEAVKIDSTFAMGHFRLALAHSWNGDNAKSVIQATLDYESGNPDRCYELLNEFVKDNTDIPDAYNLLGEVATHFSRYMDVRKQREYFEKALSIDPTFKVVFYHLIETYIQMNDVEAVERLFARYRNENPDDPAVKQGELMLLRGQRQWPELIRRGAERQGDNFAAEYYAALLATGDFETAGALVQDFIESAVGYDLGQAYGARAQLRTRQGRFTDALRDFELGMEGYSRYGAASAWSASISSFQLLQRADILLELGRVQDALHTVDRSIQVDAFSPWAYWTKGMILYRNDRISEGDAVLADLVEMSSRSFSDEPQYWIAQLQIEKHLALGELDDALAGLKSTESLYLTTPNRRHNAVVLAEILSASGDRVGAIEAYKDVLGPAYLIDIFWVNEIAILYDLAKLEEAEGDLAGAREHYEKYLAHWGDSDIPVPNVGDAKARLEALKARS